MTNQSKLALCRKQTMIQNTVESRHTLFFFVHHNFSDFVVTVCQKNLNPSHYMSPDVRKPDFCICENKGADHLRGKREADQRLCFRNTDSTIPLLSKSEISSLYPSSLIVQPGLCRTWSETP